MSDDVKAAPTVSEIVRKIKLGVRQANIGRDDEDLVVAGIDLRLRTVFDDSGGGSFEWKVPFIGLTLKGGAKVSRATRARSTCRSSPTCSRVTAVL